MKRLSVVFMTTILLSAIWSPKPVNAAQQETNMTEATTEATTEQLEKSTTEKKKNETTTVTISAAGDCILGVDSRYNNSFNTYYKNKKDPAYFFKKVKKVFEKDDITIVNFEGTLTTSTNRANKKFTFKGPASYAKILKKGSVEVVNLANNHSKDYGIKGFNDTKATLKKNDIPYCYYDTIVYKKVNGVKVAFLGFNQLGGVTKQQVKTGITQAKKKKAQIIIVSFHWGIERDYYPSGNQKSMGHYAISEGADLVLGHHPHVLQGVEKYKGRYIVYSLGNFCFGGNTNPSDKDTMIFQQTFYVKNGKLLKKNDAKVIPCSVSSVSYTNDYQPKVLTGKSKSRLIQKINRISKGMNTSANKNGELK